MDMKKIVYSILLPVVLLIATKAGAQTYGSGVNVLNVGVGFGYSLGWSSGINATPVISTSFEHGQMLLGPGTLGLGASLSYQGAKWDYIDGYGDSYHETWKIFFFGLRGTWHPDFLVSDKYDVYLGAQLGYYHYGYTYTESGPYVNNYHYSNPYSSHVGIGAFVGGRYYFTQNFGVFGEAGYDISYLKLGVALKFGNVK